MTHGTEATAACAEVASAVQRSVTMDSRASTPATTPATPAPTSVMIVRRRWVRSHSRRR